MSWRTWVILGSLVVALLVAIVYTTTREPAADEARLPPLDTRSTGPGGARALSQWLREVGYAVDSLAYRSWEIGGEVRVLFILAPIEPFTPAQLDALNRWLHGGGTLIFAPTSSARNPLAGLREGPGDSLLRELGLESSTIGESPPARLAQPIAHPPVDGLALRGVAGIEPRRTTPSGYPVPGARDAAPLLTDVLSMVPVVVTEHRTLVGFVPVGSGRVWVLGDGEWLSNGRIGEADHAALLLNMLAGNPPGPRAAILFDEWHHGYYSHEGSFSDQLVTSPWGRATIAAFLLVWLYLAFAGRRFGRPIPVPETDPRLRRSTGELVTSLAYLFRRAGKRDWALQTSIEQTTRRLGAWLGLNPAYRGEELLAALERSERLPPEAARELRELAARSERGGIGERELVNAARRLANLERRALESAG